MTDAGRGPDERRTDEGPEPLDVAAKALVVLGLLGVVAVAGFLFWRSGESPQGVGSEGSDTRPPQATQEGAGPDGDGQEGEEQQGVACSYLAEAARLLAEGDVDAFLEAVKAASRAAETALDTSGQVFGDAELAAIQLDAAVDVGGVRSQKVTVWLERGRKACEALGQWT